MSEVTKYQATPGAVLLADCSASMGERDGSDKRRIDRLAEVLAYILTYTRLQALIAFSDFPTEIPLVGHIRLPEPDGSTGLELAIEHVSRMPVRPTRMIVLSDGEPNDVSSALSQARQLAHGRFVSTIVPYRPAPPIIIDAYYIGPDLNRPATDFMAELAACGAPGGHSGHYPLADPKRIGQEIRLRITHKK